jgi:ribosomal protein L6P/L9E
LSHSTITTAPHKACFGCFAVSSGLAVFSSSLAGQAEEKDTIEVWGIDLLHVSQSAASIQQACQVKHKDIRKFLDGVYVSKRGVIRDE